MSSNKLTFEDETGEFYELSEVVLPESLSVGDILNAAEVLENFLPEGDYSPEELEKLNREWIVISRQLILNPEFGYHYIITPNK
jgi:hypothetical protein